MTRFFMACSVALATYSFASAQDRDVHSIRERFEVSRPSEKQLAFYSLDWGPTLAEAKERAAKEKRPIFFIYVTNISASTNFFSGHC